jgi:hypothetical protein
MHCQCGAHPLFDLGQIAISPEAAEVLRKVGLQLIQPLWLHVSGQWPEADSVRNEAAIRSGKLVVSVFALGDGWELVVGTDAARTTTVVDVRRGWE